MPYTPISESVGHSMGGAEVARYLDKYGSGRVRKAIFIASVNPYFLKADDNPEGLDGRIFADFQALCWQIALLQWPPRSQGSITTLASKEKLAADLAVAYLASPIATPDSIAAWLMDLRPDHEASRIPTLVIHGNADESAPTEATGRRTARYPNSKLIVIDGAPHGLVWTHAQETNKAILDFIQPKERVT